MKLNFLALFITVCAVACAEQPDSRGYVEQGSSNRSGNYYQNRYAPQGQTYGPTYYSDYGNDPGEYYRRRYVPGYAARQDGAQTQVEYKEHRPPQVHQVRETRKQAGYWGWVAANGKTAGYWLWVENGRGTIQQPAPHQGYVENPGYHYAQRYAPPHAARHVPQYIPAPTAPKPEAEVENYWYEDGSRWVNPGEYYRRRYSRE